MVITRPGSQSIVALESAELIVTTAAVEDIVQFVPNYFFGRIGARHVLDTAQDIRFHSRCSSRNDLCANEKTIASVLSELDAIHLTRERRQAVVAQIAGGVDARSADDRVVPERAVERVVAAASVEKVVLLVADDRFGTI